MDFYKSIIQDEERSVNHLRNLIFFRGKLLQSCGDMIQ